jgi:hypothetical protein
MTHILQRIADDAEALCDPRHHAERVWDYDRHRNKRIRRVHVTVQPGLLAQLAEMAEPSSTQDGSGPRSVPRSRPPLTEAGQAHADITVAAAWLVNDLDVTVRATVEANIRALVGHAPTVDLAVQARIANDLGAWRRRAEVITGWTIPPWTPVAPCPNCNQRNALRVHLDKSTATCAHCHVRWDIGSIGILARHIALYEASSRAQAAAARARHHAEQARRDTPDTKTA